MKCTKCGAQISKGEKFCSECGGKLRKKDEIDKNFQWSKHKTLGLACILSPLIAFLLASIIIVMIGEGSISLTSMIILTLLVLCLLTGIGFMMERD